MGPSTSWARQLVLEAASDIVKGKLRMKMGGFLKEGVWAFFGAVLVGAPPRAMDLPNYCYQFFPNLHFKGTIRSYLFKLHI